LARQFMFMADTFSFQETQRPSGSWLFWEASSQET